MSSHTPGESLTSTSGNPLKGTAQIPGDKSISHRSLILGAMAIGETRWGMGIGPFTGWELAVFKNQTI